MDAVQLPLRRGLTGALALAASVGICVGAALPAHADDHEDTRFNGEANTTEAIVDALNPGGGEAGHQGQPAASSGGGYEGPWTQEHLVPNCMQATLGQNEDVLCGGATTTCPEEDETRWKVYQREMSQDGPLTDWAMVGTRCEGPDTEGGVQTPEVTTEDVVDSARAAAPAPDFVIEPAEKSYVNVPTNFAAADDEPVTVTVHPLGIAIPVTFTPTSYRWDFGDGDTGSGPGVRDASVGAPGAVEHGYRSSGSYDVTLTRVYAIAFTLPNGQSVTIPGEVSATSEPQTLEVGEIQSTVTGVG